MARDIAVKQYIGIEAVDELAASAMRKQLPDTRIIHGDFVREPRLLNLAADVIVFSGSLNTLDADQFYLSLREAFEAAGEVLAFNFLAARHIANAEWLTWHRAADVLKFAGGLSAQVSMLDDYLDGDCTVAIHKS